MQLFTRYGEVNVSRHAVIRWRQRTGKGFAEMVHAIANATRPSKRQLRRIIKRAPWQPKRILECDCAYFVIVNKHIVTVYDKRWDKTNDAA